LLQRKFRGWISGLVFLTLSVVVDPKNWTGA
jgi:hypothetical protein